MLKKMESDWNPHLLIGLNFISALLLISWLWPVTRAAWDLIDISIFTNLNDSLKTGDKWQTLWAIANWRLSDVPQFILILSIAFYWIFKQNKKLSKERAIKFFIFIILCFSIYTCFKLILKILDFNRQGPTGEIAGAFQLSKTITWLTVKDYSHSAFPGDHGFVLICSIVFYWINGGFRLGLVSLTIFAPFLLPRLVVGAHWTTDIMVGSIFISLVTISCYFGTPLQSRSSLWLGRILENHFPAFNSFFKRD